MPLAIPLVRRFHYTRMDCRMRWFCHMILRFNAKLTPERLCELATILRSELLTLNRRIAAQGLFPSKKLVELFLSWASTKTSAAMGITAKPCLNLQYDGHEPVAFAGQTIPAL